MEGKLEVGDFRNRRRKGIERKDKNKNKSRKRIFLVSDLENINANNDSVTFNHVTVGLVSM